MRDLGLKDKVVLITGGAGVLGTAFSQGFADHSARLAINDLREEKALECIGKLTGEVDAVPACCDVSDDADVARMVNGVVERLGRIDVVVNAAAVQIYPPKTIIEMEPGEWDFVLDICLKAAYLTTRHVAPVMKRQGGGKIVNIASIAGHRGTAGGSAYSAAKGGVVMLTRQMAVELGRDNINVNSVSPGFTPNRLTTIYEYEAIAKGASEGPEPDHTAGEFTPPALGRKGEIEDFVGPVLFLASQWADYITGTDLPVEGGRMAAR